MNRGAFVLVLSMACGPSAAPSPSAGKPSATGAPPVVVASVAPAPAMSGAPAIVAVPNPDTDDPEKQLESIALGMCAATYREDKGKRIVGCRRPPPFKGKGRAPDGQIVPFAGDDLATFCGISFGARGSFSGPGKKETLVTVDNCRDDDSGDGWNGSLPGSAAIVTNEIGSWHLVAAMNGVNTGECTVVRRADGRDTLICRSRYDAYGIGTDYYFFSLDFGGGTPMARTFAHVFDDVENFNCSATDGTGPIAPAGITRVRGISMMTRDLNGDGTPDVVLDVDRVHVAPSAQLDAKLRAACKQSKPVDGVVPAAVKERIEVVSDGSRFRPTPAAKALLAKWRAESPDVTQLEGAAPPKVDR